jgi:putative ABC transport system ATP-binding protein
MNMEQEATAVIELKGTSKTYRKAGAVTVHALSATTLKIEPGEFVAIIGPSGSGKSTLMNILGLLDRSDTGSYRLGTLEVSELSVDALARIRNERIGFVFQSFHLLPRTTAVENVELPLIYARSGAPRAKAEAALKRVGLEDRALHFPSELSGGQQQRVAIARALVNDPDVLLADEPTGNLDTASGEEVMEIFTELNRQGTTVILITHEADIAARADRVLRIVDGKIISDERSTKERAE